MSSLSKQLVDVLAIIALGFVYVVALSVGTAVSYGFRRLDTARAGGANALRRVRGAPPTASDRR